MKKATKVITMLLAGSTIASCSNEKTTSNSAISDTTVTTATTPIVSVRDMNWLVGEWQNPSPDGIAFENWTVVNDSTLSGVSGLIKGKDTMVAETITLEQKGAEVYYIPVVKDQNDGKPVQFKLIEAAGDSVVFSNPQHDFPTKITYTRKSPATILAKISGKIEGQEHTEEFPLSKIGASK